MVLRAVAVTVPGLLEMAAARIELDKADARLQQAARDQALASEIGGARLIEPVALAGPLALAPDVDDVGGAGLHAEGQLVRLDARRQLAFARPLPAMVFVQLLEEV